METDCARPDPEWASTETRSSRSRPAAATCRSRALSCTLPKRLRSRTSHSMRPCSTAGSGIRSWTRVAGSTVSPSSSKGSPIGRCAAAGASTSRAWNDGDTGAQHDVRRRDRDRTRRPLRRLPEGCEEPVVRSDKQPSVARFDRDRARRTDRPPREPRRHAGCTATSRPGRARLPGHQAEERHERDR